jgi:diguanylate cyclase (GGDEF)-like protein
MKNHNILVWTISIIIWILPIVFNEFVNEQIEQHYLFIWSISLIPSILIMVMYPRWVTVVASAILNFCIRFAVEFFQDFIMYSNEIIPQITASLVNLSIHVTIGYFIVSNDKLKRKLERLTIIDPLTKLYNRRYFDLQLEKMIALTQRTKRPLLMLMLDIDFFKKVNDTYGHQCGDAALIHISQIMKENTRSSDVYCRIGGEEFAILLSETSLEDGRILAERMRKAVESEVFTYKEIHVPLTVSLGLAKYNGDTINELIEHADQALYQAKTNGRNRLVIFQ